MTIHPLALVSPLARVATGAEIGPFCIVEPEVTIGPGCVLHAHVVVKRGTTLGANNQIFEGTVLGGLPQHAHMPERPGTVAIGDGNVLRENVTIHRALEEGKATVVGDHNLVMVNAHIAHDCRIGSHTIITNNAMLAGHVTVDDRAYISGAVGIHQYCRVGSFAMVGGQAHVNKDIPPYLTVDGLTTCVVGLNQVGLRRAGFSQQDILQLKSAYRVIYRSGLPWAEMLEQLRIEFAAGPAAAFYAFIIGTKRGIVPERRVPPNATIKLRRGQESGSETQTQTELRVKFG